ncbi:Putative Lon protease homolog [Candidatus Erwinia haradaeae]|uniref:endopeptidase La n=1 Tax=Candidatus Erwinia haradaeae TaxID=1922217 RepID=A0A451DJT2_9GAMM|nr:Lon protease family protein [Candidatus Erwinia haradaeae]VFP86945.1 Putative Lon protease homolog [Candidatus Erwinia haradaeae]
MTSRKNPLEWHILQTSRERFQHLFLEYPIVNTDCFRIVQARLCNGLDLLFKTIAPVPIMLIKSPESSIYFTFLQNILLSIQERTTDKVKILYGGRYEIIEHTVGWYPAKTIQDNFATYGGVHQADWIEHDNLFGCVRLYKNKVFLSPGLVHHANGGCLILSLRALLAQPLMWFRLKTILTRKQYEWYSNDPSQPLPLDIPPMPMSFRLLLMGEREILEDFKNLDFELTRISLYSEFEDTIILSDDIAFMNWKMWVQSVANALECPPADYNFWSELIHEGTRWTGDQGCLPLNLDWISYHLQEARLYSKDGLMNGDNLRKAIRTRAWREGSIAEKILNNIEQEQIQIDTKGEVIGQINALSVIEFPGHPCVYGTPVRISCTVHTGDGEFIDVERKVDLGGSIHSKGLMIMQSWLMSTLKLEQNMPFSASLVFEQSYSEIDGDSSSLAALCALISALALKPINQQIAVTGSIDQLGSVQSIGGINEKIEGFFQICNQRTLDGHQGVIIPSTNIRHLALHQDVMQAIKNGTFYVWAISNVDEALLILTGIPWDNEAEPSLLSFIKERITKITLQDTRRRIGSLRWFNWIRSI